jgi:hypothetical protein
MTDYDFGVGEYIAESRNYALESYGRVSFSFLSDNIYLLSMKRELTLFVLTNIANRI